MLFVTILVHLTLARVNEDIQEMAKIALVSYICLTRTSEFIDLEKKLRNETYVRGLDLEMLMDDSGCVCMVCNAWLLDMSFLGSDYSPPLPIFYRV